MCHEAHATESNILRKNFRTKTRDKTNIRLNLNIDTKIKFQIRLKFRVFHFHDHRSISFIVKSDGFSVIEIGIPKTLSKGIAFIRSSPSNANLWTIIFEFEWNRNLKNLRWLTGKNIRKSNHINSLTIFEFNLFDLIYSFTHNTNVTYLSL